MNWPRRRGFIEHEFKYYIANRGLSLDQSDITENPFRSISSSAWFFFFCAEADAPPFAPAQASAQRPAAKEVRGQGRAAGWRAVAAERRGARSGCRELWGGEVSRVRRPSCAEVLVNARRGVVRPRRREAAAHFLGAVGSLPRTLGTESTTSRESSRTVTPLAGGLSRCSDQPQPVE